MSPRPWVLAAALLAAMPGVECKGTLASLNSLLEDQVLDRTALPLLANMSVSFLGSFPLQIQNASIRSMHVDSLEIKEAMEGEHESTLTVGLSGVGFDFRSHYYFAPAYGSPENGTLNLSAPLNDATIYVVVRFTGPSPFRESVPTNATFDNCSIDLGNFSVSADGGLSFLFSKSNMKDEIGLACSTILPPLLSQFAGNASETLGKSARSVDPTSVIASSEAAIEKKFDTTQLVHFSESGAVGVVEHVVTDVLGGGGLKALMDNRDAWVDVDKNLNLGPDFPRSLQARPGKSLYSNSRANITLAEINVTGLDNIAGLRLNGHAGNYSLAVGLEMGKLDVSMVLDLDLANPVTGYRTSNSVSARAELRGAAVNLTLLVAVNGTMADQLEPGMLIEAFREGGTAPLLCGLYPVVALNISSLAIGIGGMPPPVEYGLLPTDGIPSELDVAIDSLLKGVFETYGAGLFEALPGLTNEYLLPELLKSAYWQSFIAPISAPLPLEYKCPPQSRWAPLPDPIEFYNNSVVKTADWVVNDLLKPPSAGDVNAMIRALVQGLAPGPTPTASSDDGNAVTFVGKIFNYTLVLPGAQPNGDSLGVAAVEIWDLTLSGYSSITSLDVLKPRGPHERFTLDNALSAEGPLVANLTVRVTLEGPCAPVPIDDSLRISVGIEGLRAAAAVMLRLNGSAAAALSVDEVKQNMKCLATVFSGSENLLRIPEHDLAMFFDHFAMDAQCVPGRCSSPDMDKLHGPLTSPAGSAQLDRYARYVFNRTKKLAPQLLDLLGWDEAHINTYIDQAIVNASENCTAGGSTSALEVASGMTPVPSSDESDGPLTVGKVYAILYGFSGAVFLILVGVTVWTYTREDTNEKQPLLKRRRNQLLTPESGPRKHRASSVADSVRSKSSVFEGTYVPATHLALAQHPAIPRAVRILHPILLLGSAGIFISSNLGVGAQINAKVTLAGSEIDVDNIFSYGLANTVCDFWNGKIYPLSILVGLLSGAWPYVKTSLLLFCWFVPPWFLTHDRRGFILRVLDILGKWSLIDEFLIIMMINAFHIVITNPSDWIFLPTDILNIEVTVDPKYGIHGFLLAAILSLALNHAQIIWHRNAMEADEGRDRGWFAVGAEDNSRQVLAKVAGTPRAVGVTVLLVVAGVCLLVGTIINTFDFKFEGLAAIVLDADAPGGDQADYSVFKLAKGMIDQGGPSTQSWLAYGWLMVCFVLFAVVVPLLQVIMLLVLWLSPLELRNQKRLFFFNEILAAWSSIEVLIVSLLAALLQISQLAKFILGNRCDLINDLMRQYGVPLGLFAEDQAKCFDVHAELLSGCWILFAACVLVNVAYQVAYRASEEAIELREAQIADQDDEGDEDGDGKEPRGYTVQAVVDGSPQPTP
eukprot:TRINITY_DN2875_c0_g4_i1.p1 TRINITY_DN2875_c0_g4~~TRINITY_DN2875_c0_g4_i1.p1  ORF type:complete len:1382 (+),score=505.85 TRINITY_DN2875_c0_g4_i1:81-4226(+)